MKRERLENVKAVRMATKVICLGPGQCWYETEKAYEAWQEKPVLWKIKRIPKDRVFFVHEKGEEV